MSSKMKTLPLLLLSFISHTQAFSSSKGQTQAHTRAAPSLSASLSDDDRVVVTGLGVISGCGVTPSSFFQSCCQGKSSIHTITRFDISNYPCKIGSEVPESLFDPSKYFTNPKNVKSNDRFTHFAVAAARQALQDAQLGDTPDTMSQADRVGVMVGSAFGGVETFEQETLKLASKPERPKVWRMDLCILDWMLYWMDIKSLFSKFYIGIAIYYSSLVGEYSIWSDWY